MLHSPIYIISASMLESGAGMLPGKDVAVYCGEEPNAMKAVYAVLMRDETLNSFHIDYRNSTVDPSEIVAFFFSPRYKFSGSKPMLLGPGASVSGIETYAAAQGFGALDARVVERGVSLFDAGEEQLLRSSYRDGLYASGIPGDFYVNIGRLEEIERVERLFNEEEEFFKEKEPQVYDAKSRLQAEYEKAERYERKAAAAEREVRTLTEHMDGLRSSTQAAQLQQYYDNEYESLPGWYKRLGHVLKVLTGKRRFKSLFSDSEKKYYD